MKLAFITDGTWGDILPFAFVLKELKGRGHEATLFTNAFYETFAHTHDIPFASTTSAASRTEFLSNPDLWHPTRGIAFLGKATDEMFEESYPILEENLKDMDAIISHSFTYAAKTLAEKYNIPYIALYTAPMQVRSLHRFPVFYGGKNPNTLPWFIRKIFYPIGDRFFLDPYFGKKVNKKRKELGLAPASSFVHWGTSDFLTIGLWPSWYAQPEIDQPFLKTTTFPQIEFNTHDDPELIDWIQRGAQPTVVTLGSGYLFTESLKVTLEEISRSHGERFILIAPHEERDMANDTVAVIHNTHLSSVLARSKLLINHGGAGTLAQGVHAGIPQLIIPQGHDQHDNAFRIQEHNLGDVLWSQHPTAEELYIKMQSVLSSTLIHEQCIKAKNQLEEGTDACVRAADLIEEKLHREPFNTSR